ncbi:hypothetical protein QFZ82_005601 [Streptomyces sp. V4I23]|nr:hypothetical protein [Streptomyces sp. V4I23]
MRGLCPRVSPRLNRRRGWACASTADGACALRSCRGSAPNPAPQSPAGLDSPPCLKRRLGWVCASTAGGAGVRCGLVGALPQAPVPQSPPGLDLPPRLNRRRGMIRPRAPEAPPRGSWGMSPGAGTADGLGAAAAAVQPVWRSPRPPGRRGSGGYRGPGRSPGYGKGRGGENTPTLQAPPPSDAPGRRWRPCVGAAPSSAVAAPPRCFPAPPASAPTASAGCGRSWAVSVRTSDM